MALEIFDVAMACWRRISRLYCRVNKSQRYTRTKMHPAGPQFIHRDIFTHRPRDLRSFFYNFYQLRDPLCPLSLSRQNATERADPQALFVERRIASRTVDPQN